MATADEWPIDILSVSLVVHLYRENARFTALRVYFKTLVFTGKGTQPKAFASDAEVLKYVASTKGAIGYVSPSADTPARRRSR